MNHLTELVLTGLGSGVASSAVIVGGLNLLGVIGKTKSDRTTARETAADAATQTALKSLQTALDEQERALGKLREDHERETGSLTRQADGLRTDVDNEKGKRAEAEETVEMLRVSVDALAERIEEQNRELAAQPKLKAENARLRRQVGELQKQVGELKKRIADLEVSRQERVGLETEIFLAQAGGDKSLGDDKTSLDEDLTERNAHDEH